MDPGREAAISSHWNSVYSTLEQLLEQQGLGVSLCTKMSMLDVKLAFIY